MEHIHGRGGDYNYDVGAGIAIDSNGSVYVVGESDSTWGNPINPHCDSGYNDIFVAKLNGNGVLQWNTFIGAHMDLDAHWCSIAVDDSGSVYIAGRTQATWGSPINLHAGDSDAFVVKFNNEGVRQWHTFMGSSGRDRAMCIAVDSSSNIYVAGNSPDTWGSPINPFTGLSNAFIAKLNSNGIRQWHTFMGPSSLSNGAAGATCIAVDGSDYIYVAGCSYDTWGSPINPYSGGDYTDAFVAKLNNNGVRQWHTFMGSSSNNNAFGTSDAACGIVVDGAGNICVAGDSYDTWGSPINPHSGGVYSDVFVARLNNNGVRQWHTFMGSSSNDEAKGITVDGAGNIYVVGKSYDTWGSPINPHAGGWEAFVAKLNNSGVRRWNTFMGSSSNDGVAFAGIVVDGSDYIYVAGNSYETWGSPINPLSGGHLNTDAFVAKLLDVSVVHEITMPWIPLLLLNE